MHIIIIIILYGTVSMEQNHPSAWVVFKFLIFRELQELLTAVLICILNWTIRHKVIRHCIYNYSHTFQCECYISFACPGKFEKVS